LGITRRSFFKKTAKATAAVSIAPGLIVLNQSEVATELNNGTLGTASKGEAAGETVIENLGVFKRAELSPNKVLAGDNAVFIITLTIGKKFVSGPSRIMVNFPGTLGQSRPSLMHHEDFGFIEVYVSNPDVTYSKRNWDMRLEDFASKGKSSWRRKGERIFVLDLSKGLKENDTIKIHWGDNQRGFGPGTSTTCVIPLPDYESKIHVRYFDNHNKGLPDFERSFKGYDRPVPNLEMEMAFRVLPRDVHHFQLIRKVNKAILIPNDRFWNVAPVKDLSLHIKADENPGKNNLGVFEFTNKNVSVLSRKLTLFDAPDMDNVFDGKNIYWGELHSHSMFSNDTIEREKMQIKPDELMEIARQRSGLDFFSLSDHHQPWDKERNKIGKQNWEKTIDAVGRYNKPGEFLVFPGFEYRGKRGDTIITFGWLPDYDEIDKPEWQDIRNVWKDLKGKDYLTHPHFHSPGKLEKGQWWENKDHNVEPVLEIFSCHGSYERKEALENGRAMIKRFRSDRCGAWFIKKGYHYGFVCNSDSHKGHVGLNGLTAVYAKSLDQQSIFEAYQKRHVYGTTNARIRLVFTSNGRLMGSVIQNSEEKLFTIDVIGEYDLKKIDLFRNGELYKRFFPQGKKFQTEYSVKEAEPSNWYVRVTQIDNQIAWSSPVWYE